MKVASPNGDGYFFRRSVNFVDTSVKRGDIYYADLSPVVGSEQGGIRPVLIIQNDTGNRYSPTVIAAAITSQTGKARLPTHIALPVNESCGLNRDSIILLEQVRTLDKRRIGYYIGKLPEEKLQISPSDIIIKKGRMEAENIILRGLPATNYTGNFNIGKDNILKISNINLNLTGGTVQGLSLIHI